MTTAIAEKTYVVRKLRTVDDPAQPWNWAMICMPRGFRTFRQAMDQYGAAFVETFRIPKDHDEYDIGAIFEDGHGQRFSIAAI